MNEDGEGEAGRRLVSVAVTDPELAERLREAIAGDPGLMLLPAGFPPDEADVFILDAADAGGSLDAPAILLTDERDAIHRLREGASAVLPPDIAARQLRAAIHAVAANLIVLTIESLRDEAREDAWDEAAEDDLLTGKSRNKIALTPREIEVLALLAEGASNKLIARRLGISFGTAKFHVASLLAKLGARSRSDALAQGLRRGHIML